jgi:hypothetical protein
MANETRRTKQRVDDDGVRIVQGAGVRGSVWRLALALGLVGIAVILLVRPPSNRPASNVEEPRRAPANSLMASNQLSPQHQLLPQAPAQAPAVPPTAGAAAEGAVAGAAQAEPAAIRKVPRHQAVQPGATHDDDTAAEAPMFGPLVAGEGIAAFPPPGTKPIKRGILVPDDFELPPGFVRHYQATDDGEQVPAILMFHPDYQPVDERGVPIPLPANRVVPPEMAPAGLPIQMLEVPDDGTTPGSPP